jgi:hypothetical protein
MSDYKGTGTMGTGSPFPPERCDVCKRLIWSDREGRVCTETNGYECKAVAQAAAYKRAWQRDMEKGREFLAERDAARAEVERLRGSLEAIAEYGMDWTVGADANLARVQAMAERALRPPGNTASTAAVFMAGNHPSCPECASVMIPDGDRVKCVNCGRTAVTGEAQ